MADKKHGEVGVQNRWVLRDNSERRIFDSSPESTQDFIESVKSSAPGTDGFVQVLVNGVVARSERMVSVMDNGELAFIGWFGMVLKERIEGTKEGDE